MEFYHILNRGVEERNVVKDDGDRMRFVQSLYTFNDENPVPNGKTQQNLWGNLSRKRDQLVYIHAWCLMDNHYHILLSPKDDNPVNISKFAKKLNMGYAKFFNEKYDRSGYLWQGKYKKIMIESDRQFVYIPYYIHLNPLDYTHPEWRDGAVKNPTEAVAELEKYRWSSFLDYQGIRNFPSLINTSVLKETLSSKQEQLKQIKNIIHTPKSANQSNIIES